MVHESPVSEWKSPSHDHSLFSEQDRSRSPMSLGQPSFARTSSVSYKCPQKELSPGILLDSHSTRISVIAKWSPADLGRVLRRGDHIVAVNGVPCDNEGLRKALFGNKNVIGSSVNLTIERGNESLTAPVLLTPLQDITAKDKLWGLAQELKKTFTILAGRKAGIGLVLTQDSSSNTVVERLVDNSPAKLNGRVKRNDILFSIDGTKVDGQSAEQVSELLAGKEGTVCHLVLLRGPDRVIEEVSLQRAVPSASGALNGCSKTIEQITTLLEATEQQRQFDLSSFLHHFHNWQRDVQKWMKRLDNHETLSFSKSGHSTGSITASAAKTRSASKERSRISREIKMESLCEQKRQNRESMHMSYIVHFWGSFQKQCKRRRWLSARAAESLRWRRQRRSWDRVCQYVINHRILRRQATKGLVRRTLLLARAAFDGWNDSCLASLDNFKEAFYWSRLGQQGARSLQVSRMRRTWSIWAGDVRETKRLQRGVMKIQRKHCAGFIREWWLATCHSRRTRWLSLRKAMEVQTSLVHRALNGWLLYATRYRSLVERGIRLLTFRNRKAMDLSFCALLYNVMNKQSATFGPMSPSRMSTRAFSGVREVRGHAQPSPAHKRHMSPMASATVSPTVAKRKPQFLGVYRSKILQFVDAVLSRNELTAMRAVLRVWSDSCTKDLSFRARATYGMGKVRALQARHKKLCVIGKWGGYTAYIVRLRDVKLALMRQYIRVQLLAIFAEWNYIKLLSRPPPKICLPLTVPIQAALSLCFDPQSRWKPAMAGYRRRITFTAWQKAVKKERRARAVEDVFDDSLHSKVRSSFSCWRLLCGANVERRAAALKLFADRTHRRALYLWRVSILASKTPALPPPAPAPPQPAYSPSSYSAVLARADAQVDSDIDDLLVLARGTTSKLSKAAASTPPPLPIASMLSPPANSILAPLPRSERGYDDEWSPTPNIGAGRKLHLDSPVPMSPVRMPSRSPHAGGSGNALTLDPDPDPDHDSDPVSLSSSEPSETSGSAQPVVPVGDPHMPDTPEMTETSPSQPAAAPEDDHSHISTPARLADARIAAPDSDTGTTDNSDASSPVKPPTRAARDLRLSEMQLSDSIMDRLRGLRERTQQLEADLLRGPSASSSPSSGVCALPP